MTEITVEEAETVTKEVTKYECDKCSYCGPKEEFQEYRIGPNTVHSEAVAEFGHLCDDCLEADRYATLNELADDRQRLAELIEWTGSVAPPSLAFTLGATLASGVAWLTITEWWTPYEVGGTVFGAALAGAMVSALFAVGLYAINARLTA